MRLLRFLIPAVLLSLVAALAPASAQAKLRVGISENAPAMFGDPLFTGLGVKQVRLVVSWDAVAAGQAGDNEMSDKVIPYVNAAAAQGIDVLVSFQHSRGQEFNQCGSSCKAPSVKAYKAQVKAFLTAVPQVKTISPWNEANHSTQPVYKNPKRAGQYAKAVDQVCKSIKRKCTNVVMDILDTADNTHAKKLKYRKTARYIKKLRKGYGKRPSVCGIHNYADVNRFRVAGTKQLTRAMKCRHYWLTETGGIFKFGGFWKKAARKEFKCKSSNACQKKAMTYLFKKTVKAAKHIDRAYIFNFYRGVDGIHDYGITTGSGVDGATDRFGGKRPAYSVVAKRI